MSDPITAFDVLLNEVHVGQLSFIAQTNHTAFVLSQGYMAQENPPILSQSFRNKLGGFTRTRQSTMVSLPPFFSNLLPEKGLLRSLLIKRASLRATCDFELLSLLREDLPGAVLLQPAAGQPLPGDIQITDSTTSSTGFNPAGPLRFSLAGVQLKFSGSLKDGRLTIPVTGAGGDWIVKVPHNQYPLVSENEYSIMAFAKSIGINVPPISLLEPKEIEGLPPEISLREGKSYIIKRFDRSEIGRRIHIEDFAQVFNLQPVHKYDEASYGNIAGVIWRECGEVGLTEFIRRLVFSVITGNMDMHLKNWSLIYTNPSKPELSPAYDLLSTIVYPGGYEKLALSLSGTKKAQLIHSGHFKKMAAAFQLPEALVLKIVTETGQAIANSWRDYRDTFPESLLPALEQHMQSVPLLPKTVSVPVQVTIDSNIAMNKEHLRKREWLEKLIEQEFEKASEPLEIIRHTLRSISTESCWEEDHNAGSLTSSFQRDGQELLLSFECWTNSQGREVELKPSKDTMVIAHPVGPHLIVKFRANDGSDLKILGFKYIIFNGKPGWETLAKSTGSATFLTAEQTAALLKEEFEALAGGKPKDEDCSIDIEYLTQRKKLVTVRDSAQHIRGSCVLENQEIINLLSLLEPNEKPTLPSQAGTGLRFMPMPLSKAQGAGLIGRFTTDRDKELAGKEIINERLGKYFLKYPVNGFTQSHWQETKYGATLFVSADKKEVSIDFSLRDLFGVISDGPVLTKIDGQLYRLVRGMDPHYSEAVEFLLAMHGKTQVPDDTADDLRNYLSAQGWIGRLSNKKGHWITTQGMMETLKHQSFPAATSSQCASCGKALGAGEGINTPSRGTLCRKCFG